MNRADVNEIHQIRRVCTAGGGYRKQMYSNLASKSQNKNDDFHMRHNMAIRRYGTNSVPLKETNAWLFQQRQQLNQMTIFSHTVNPLKTQIGEWKPSPQMLRTKERIQNTSPIFINTRDSAMKMLHHLQNQNQFSFDTESYSNGNYYGIICLIQIATNSKTYLIDTLTPELNQIIRNELKSVFQDPNILKIAHGSANDIISMQRDFHIFIVGLMELQEVYSQFQKEESIRNNFPILNDEPIGLEQLAFKELRIQPHNKVPQLSDWRNRPLHTEQLKYAAEDCELVYDIWHKWSETITRKYIRFTKDSWNTFPMLSKSKELTSKCYTFPKPKSYLKDKYYATLPQEYKQVFYTLFQWRRIKAKELDQPELVLLASQSLVDIAKARPKTIEALFQCSKFSATIKPHLHEIMDILSPVEETDMEIEYQYKESETTTSIISPPKEHDDDILEIDIPSNELDSFLQTPKLNYLKPVNLQITVPRTPSPEPTRAPSIVFKDPTIENIVITVNVIPEEQQRVQKPTPVFNGKCRKCQQYGHNVHHCKGKKDKEALKKTKAENPAFRKHLNWKRKIHRKIVKLIQSKQNNEEELEKLKALYKQIKFKFTD